MTARTGARLLLVCASVGAGVASLTCGPPRAARVSAPTAVVSSPASAAPPSLGISALAATPPPAPSYGHRPTSDIDSTCVGGGLVSLMSFDPGLPARMREGANDRMHYQRRDEITFKRRFRVAHSAEAFSLRTEATTFTGAVRKTLARESTLRPSSGSSIDSRVFTISARDPIAVASAAGGPSTGTGAAEASALLGALRELPGKLPTGEVVVGALDKEIARTLAMQVGATLQALTRALPSVEPLAASVSGTKTIDDVDMLLVVFEARLTWPMKITPWTAKVQGTAQLRLLDGLATDITATGDVGANDDGASGFEEGQFLQVFTVCRHDQRTAVTGGR